MQFLGPYNSVGAQHQNMPSNQRLGIIIAVLMMYNALWEWCQIVIGQRSQPRDAARILSTGESNGNEHVRLIGKLVSRSL